MKRSIRGVFTPKILIPLLAVGAVGFGAVGVMSLLERRGEAAIGMIPADAAIAFSFDNTPSPSQVVLFKEISDSMEDSGVNRFVDEMMEEMGMPAEVRAIKDNLKGSFAVGVWGNMAAGKPDMILAAALNSTASAEKIVKEHGKRIDNVEVPAYQMEADVVVAFHEDYALVTNSLDNLKRSLDAAKGTVESMDEVGAFKEARESLPSDASLMFFANGDAIAKADEETRKMYEALGIEKAGWAAMGATVLEEGIQVDMYQDTSGAKEFALAYEQMPELNYSSANRLPSGAIGILGISDAGTMIEAIMKSFSASDMAKEITAGVDDMEKEVGLTLEEDLIPALAGETYLALYPPKKGEDEPTFVLMFDEQNGGTPEKAARKIIAKVDEFEPRKVGEAEVFYTNDGDPSIAILPNQVVITNDPALVATQTNNSLTANGSLAKFDEGEPAKFKLQIDLKRLFAVIREFGGEDVPAIEQILSQDTLDCSWTVEDGISKGRALIPIKLPELIRLAGKEIQKQKSASQSMEGEALAVPESVRELPPMDPADKDELMDQGKQVAKALQLYAKDHEGKFPEYSEFGKGAIDPYLKDKNIREEFMYMPPLPNSDPKKTELGFFMYAGGRVVVYQDGNVKHESYDDWGDDKNEPR
jgi:hypothetical protein